MGVRLAAIQVDKATPRSVFRITSPTGPARLLVLGVSHAHRNALVWEIATAGWAGRPTYAAGAQIILDAEPVQVPIEPGSEVEGEPCDLLALLEDNRVVSSVTYGEVPTGFQQTYPEHAPAPALQPGAGYTVAVIGACLGEAVFTA